MMRHLLGITVASGSLLLIACGGNSDTDAPAADGRLPVDPAHGTASPSTLGSLGFRPSNLANPDFSNAGDVDVRDSDCVADGDQGTLSCLLAADALGLGFSKVRQADGSPLAVFTMKSLTVYGSARLTLRGSLPIAFVVQNEARVFGSIAAEENPTGSAGGHLVTTSGHGGGPGGGESALSDYAGAGGGSFCGRGGQGSPSLQNTNIRPQPGAIYGQPTLIPLMGGSSGGGLEGQDTGGAGGGAFALIAGQSIYIAPTGVLNMAGRGGRGNGGAGGSGGAILLEAPSVAIHGTVTANGGGGNAFVGAARAQSGQPSSKAALGTLASSGVGSAGENTGGLDGEPAGEIPNHHGAGGGGAGRIRINTASGQADQSATTVLSPSLTTPCTTQGTLLPLAAPPPSP